MMAAHIRLYDKRIILLYNELARSPTHISASNADNIYHFITTRIDSI